MRAGWRIYEGCGAVKGFLFGFCFVWRSEQPPQLKAAGCEGSHTSRSKGRPAL